MEKYSENKSNGAPDYAHDRDESIENTVVESGPDHNADNEFKITLSFLLTVAVLTIGYNGAFFALSLVAPIIKIIDADIGPVPYYSWMAIAWTFSNGIMITVSGRMMDIWGRRWIMIVGQILGVIGCIIAGTAKSVGIVIAGISIIGCGAGIQQQTSACLAELVPKKYRPLINGVIAATIIVPGVFGTPIAYVLVTNASWRWSFWITLVTDGIALVGTFFFYHPPSFQQKYAVAIKTRAQLFAEFDWGGLFLFVASMSALLLGINWGGASYPWTSASTIVPIALGGSGLLAFGLYEAYMPLTDPLIPHVLAKDIRGFVMVIVTVFVAGMLLYSLSALWPAEVAAVYSSDTSVIGWMGTTVVGGTVLGSLILAVLLKPLGHARIIYIVSVAAQTIFIGTMAAMTPETLAAAVTLSSLGGLFIGFVQIVSISMIIVQVPDKHLGIAVGLSGTARLVGGAVATSIYSTILNNKVSSVLPTNVAGAVMPLGIDASRLPTLIYALLSGNETAVMEIPGVDSSMLAAASKAVKESYSQGFRLVYLVSIAFGSCAVISAAFTRNIGHQLTDHVAAKLN